MFGEIVVWGWMVFTDFQTRGTRGVCIAWSYGERTTEKDRGTTVVDEDYTPKTNAELTFLFAEKRNLREMSTLGRGNVLSRRVVVETEFDRKANKASDKTPQSSSLTLKKQSELISGRRKKMKYLGIEVPM